MTIFKNTAQKKFFVTTTLLTLVVSSAGFLVGLRSTWGGLINFFGVEGGSLGLASLPFALASLGAGLFGWVIGLVISLFLASMLSKKWMGEFGYSEGEQKAERTRLTCLSFLAFLVLLWCLIVAIARF